MHIFGGLYMKRLLSVALAFLLMLGLASPALAAKAKAVTMRVELVEGSVTIRDAGGVALDYFEGIQLYSGYSVETGDDSCAYISLDEDKAIKLAMNTTVTIKKSGRKLQVKLKAGEIVFNVTTPLAGNETLEIRTSTMITGVRGSSGGVNAETGEIFYGTGHGIVWFRETDQTSSLYGLSQRTELWGGRIVSVNWPVKDMELSDFSALFLGEVAENPDLQNSLKMEGRFDPQDMINLLPLILEAEIAAREEAKSSAVPLPESATDSPVNGDNVNPAFNNNWDLPTIVTPPPIIDLDDFIIPDDPMNPDEPETTAYTVTWQDEDGTILETDKNVPVGTVPEFNGSDPIKAADAQYTYTFAGWDSIPAAVTGDAIYTATYKGTPKTYTVTWKVDDETTTVKYDYGSVIVPPADPTKTGYTFTGWGGNVPETMPAENLSFTAQWDVNTYTVTWKQDDGTLINTTTVAYGEVPTHAAPTKEADAQYTYTFAGWNTTPVAVTGDAEYTAMYSSTVNTYTVTWMIDGESSSVDYEYGSTITPPADPTKTGYSFAGWHDGNQLYASTDELPNVTKNVIYTAQWNVNKYTITFVDEDGTAVLFAAEYEYGTAAASISTPTVANKQSSTLEWVRYVFKSWDREITDVTGNATYQATYTTEYRVTFVMEEAGMEAQTVTQYVVSGSTAADPGLVPTKEGYEISGWYTDNGTFTNRFDFASQITGDSETVLYAKLRLIPSLVTLLIPNELEDYIEGSVKDTELNVMELTDYSVMVPYGTEILVSFSLTDLGYDTYAYGPNSTMTAGGEVIASGVENDGTYYNISYTVKGDTTITVNDLYHVVTSLSDTISTPSAIIDDVNDVNVASSYTLSADLYISYGVKVNITDDAVLTINEGITVTNNGTIFIGTSATLINNGTITNDYGSITGTLENLENNGTLND